METGVDHTFECTRVQLKKAMLVVSCHAYHPASCAAHVYCLDIGIYHGRHESDDPVFAAGEVDGSQLP